MEGFEVVLAAVLVAVAVLNAVASRIGVPYPIVLVLGGLVLGLLPGLPEVELDPDLVLLVFLPPLLYVAAFFADLRALRNYARALTAIGLVLFTMVLVAVAGHAVLGLPLPVAFALAAIVSPTDPVAATAIMRRLGAPRRIVDVVEGESLVNDAAALAAYRVAVAAAVAGTFSPGRASAEFVLSVVGGVVLGLAVGWVIGQVRERLDDGPTEITITLVSGYTAFLPAEKLHLSGVLAVVAAGLYLGWRAPDLASPQTRLQAFSVWEVLTFLLNAILFVLIGLQLPIVLDDLAGRSVMSGVGHAVLVCAVVIGTRFVWLFATPYAIRAIDRRPRQRELRVGAAERAVVAWSGLRGAVSLATRPGAAAGDRRGQPVAGTRPRGVRHLRRRARDRGGPGAHPALGGPAAGRGGRRARRGARGAARPPRGEQGGAHRARGHGRRGLGRRRGAGAGARLLRAAQGR